MKRWWYFFWNRYDMAIILTLSGILVVSLLVLMAWAMDRQQAAWERFSTEHQCRVIGKMSGDVVIGTGVTANGQVTTTVGDTGDKTGYICNDGVTYWR